MGSQKSRKSSGNSKSKRGEERKGATAKKEKIAAAVASEYQKIHTVFERAKVKKRPLSVWTIKQNKRLKTQKDTIQNMPIWMEDDVEALELNQQISAGWF